MTRRQQRDRQLEAHGSRKPRTVLLVDDDAVTRMLVAHKIASMGVEVVEANDGVQALRSLTEARIDLVIADLEMPNMDGWDVIAYIRGTPGISHLPIIVLTGNAERDVREKSLAKGATSYLRKPLNWTALAGQVNHLLQLPCTAKT
jgi:CheY-like chemotaxis protein